ncbi:MAG: HEAT repeat domain-containing protein [Planctomycetota bacterium]|nr:HEAT repeat domain-containing protein [Planctomycetota bacterium]
MNSPAIENEAQSESAEAEADAPEKSEASTKSADKSSNSEIESPDSKDSGTEAKSEAAPSPDAENTLAEEVKADEAKSDEAKSDEAKSDEAKAEAKTDKVEADSATKPDVEAEAGAPAKDDEKNAEASVGTPVDQVAQSPKPVPRAPVGTGGVIFQFVVFPLSIVLGIVGIFAFFNWAMSDHRSYNDYLHAIDQGWESERWQAAYELQFRITDRGDKLRETADIMETLRVYENSKTFKDQRVRSVLTILLGHLGDLQAEEALVEALSDKTDDTRLNAVFALGRLKSKLAVPSFLAMLANSDMVEESKRDSFYKVIAYSLGEIGDPSAIPALKKLLRHQGQVDVGWNAALALARFGDKSALGTLSAMMSRPNLEGIQTMNAKSRDLTIINALKGARMLKAESLRDEIELLKADSSFRVRQAALEVLKSLDQKEPAKDNK